MPSFPFRNYIEGACCETIENVIPSPCPWFLAQRSWDSCNFLGEKTTWMEHLLFWYLYLTPSLSQGSWNACGFLSRKRTRAIFCSFGATLVGSWKGLFTRKTRPWLEAWSFQSCPSSSRQETGLEMELIVDHACLRKPSWNSNNAGLRESKHSHNRRAAHPTPVRGTSQTSSECLFVCILYHIL